MVKMAGRNGWIMIRAEISIRARKICEKEGWDWIRDQAHWKQAWRMAQAEVTREWRERARIRELINTPVKLSTVEENVLGW